MSKNQAHQCRFPMPRTPAANSSENCKNCHRPSTSSSNAVARNRSLSSVESGATPTVEVEEVNETEIYNKSSDKSSLSANHRLSNIGLEQSDDAKLVGNNVPQCSCIVDRLRGLLNSETLSDVSFKVAVNLKPLNSESTKPTDFDDDESELIHAHKLILSMGSPVFMAMFFGSGIQLTDPSSSSSSTPIRITDVDASSFKSMLAYLYTDDVSSSLQADSVMSLLYCAKKYAIDALESECVEYLKRNLAPDNAFLLLEQAVFFEERALIDSCLEFIDRNCDECCAAECFLEANSKTIEFVLGRDSLDIREFNLFVHLGRWAHNKCVKDELLPVNRTNKRKVLGDLIKQVRFPLMTREEFAFAMQDPEARLIDDQHIIDLFIHLSLDNTQCQSTNGASSSIMPKKQLPFSSKSRCCLRGVQLVINRFGQIDSRWGYSGTSDRVRFSVNRRIFIAGFGLFGSIYGKCEYSVVIKLIHFNSSSTLAQNSTTFVCDGSNSTFRVLFEEPVEIMPDVDYIASATIKGPDSYYGTKGQRKVTHECATNGNKVTFNFQYVSGNNNGTNVEDGQIPEIIFMYSSS